MAEMVTRQELINAKRDARDLGKAVNEKVIVSPRYGEDFKSLPMISAEFQISSNAAEAAAAIAQSSANIAQSSANIAEAAATAATIGAGVFETPEAGVDPVTGVADGAYYNVRSSSDESYVDEYQNVGGVATATGKSYPSSQVVSAIDRKIKRENVSVWDFFTPQEISNYNESTNKDGFDVYRPVQEFLDYIVANDVGTAYCNIRGGLTQGLKLGDGSSATQQVIGRCMFTALNAINIMFEAQPGNDFFWDGMIVLNGTGGNSYNSRTCHTGFRIGDTENIKRGARCRFSKVFARRFTKWGVDCNNSTSLTDIDVIRTTDCGSGFRPADNATFSRICTISDIVRNGSSGEISQRSTITVSALPKGLSVGDSFSIIVIKGQPYYITNVLSETSLEVFPWIDFDVLSGDAGYYIDGGGVFIRGGDASVLGMQSIDAVRCGSVVWYNALYGPSIDRVVTQSCGAAIVYGSSPASPTVAANINYLYCEANQFDLIRVTRALGRLSVSTDVAFDINKVAYTCAPRTSSNQLVTHNNLQGFQITYAGNAYESERVVIGSFNAYSTAITDKYDYITYANNHTINISEPNIKLLEAFGKNHRAYVVMGSGAGYAPSGSVTINAPTGFTINGGASVSYTDLSSVCYVDVLYRPTTQNFIATLRNQIRYVSATYDPPSIDAGAVETTTVTLTGAAVGDIVQAAFTRYNAGIEISAVVSSANTVTVRFKNTSAAPIDLVSGTLKVKLV